MHFMRLSGAVLLTISVCGAAVAQDGSNRLLSFAEDGTGSTTQNDLLANTSVNGFTLLVSGEFGFGPVEQMYLLNREGSNRVLHQDASQVWNTTPDNFVEATAVNGFEMAVAGEFGFGPGEEVYLLNSGGSNRFVYQGDAGAWAVTQDDMLPATSVNGYTMAVAGDFGFGPGDEIFLLNHDGMNRVLYRNDDGGWETTPDNYFEATGVNGFETLVAADLGFGPGDEIYMLNSAGANRVLHRDPEGNVALTQDDFLPATSVNGFTMAAAGEFGFGPTEEVYLLNREGANRVMYVNDEGAWGVTQDDLMPVTSVNGFSKITGGRFTDGPLDSVYMLN